MIPNDNHKAKTAAHMLRDYQIISDQIDAAELSVILTQLEAILRRDTPGDVVELGCYVGTTSLFLQRMILQLALHKTLHVYDSFAGLPPKTAPDASPAGRQFKSGELIATKAEFAKHFRQARLPLPVIHKGWFNELTPQDMPEQIAFAFLDGDFYESIRDSLRLVWPRLTPGATVIVDDYQSEALPGARRAVDEWLRDHPARIRAQASLAIINL